MMRRNISEKYLENFDDGVMCMTWKLTLNLFNKYNVAKEGENKNTD